MDPWSVPFVLAATVPLALALRGGSADAVARGEAGVVLLWGVALAVIFGVLPRARPSNGLRLAIWFGGGFLVLTGVSIAWSESAELSLAEANRVSLYLGVLALAAFGLSARTWRTAASGLAIAALALPVVSVLSRLAPAAFESLGIEVFAGRRLLYPLGYWNAIACWSGIALAIAVGFSAHIRAGPWRVLALAVAPVAGTAIYLTYSRGGVVAGLLGLVVVILLSPRRGTAALHALAALLSTALAVLAVRSQPEIANGTGDGGAGLVALGLACAAAACGFLAAQTARGRWARARRLGRHAGASIAASAAVGVVVVLALGGVGAGAEERTLASAPSADPAERLANLESERYEIWASAVGAFADQPLMGLGAGGFEFWWNRDGAENESVRDVHSLYLEAGAELGLPGVILIVGFLGCLLLAALGGFRTQARVKGEAGVAGTLVASFIVFLFAAGIDWMWEIPALTILAISAAGIAAAALSSVAPRRKRLTPALLGAAFLAILAGAAQVPGTVSLQRVRASEARIEIGDPAGAIREAAEAIKAEPWGATPYAQRAIAHTADGDLEAATGDIEEAIARERTNWRHWLLLARIHAANDHGGKALEALEVAQRLSPEADAAFEALRLEIRVGLQGEG